MFEKVKKEDLLNEKDIKNIEMREKCYDEINYKVNKYREEIEKEVFDSVKEQGFNEIEMQRSKIKASELSFKLRHSQKWFENIIYSVCMIVCAFAAFNFNGKPKIHYAILGIIMLVGGIFNLFLGCIEYKNKKEIIKNFKDRNIKY